MDTLLQFALRSCSAESIPVSSLYLLLFEREDYGSLFFIVTSTTFALCVGWGSEEQLGLGGAVETF